MNFWLKGESGSVRKNNELYVFTNKNRTRLEIYQL